MVLKLSHSLSKPMKLHLFIRWENTVVINYILSLSYGLRVIIIYRTDFVFKVCWKPSSCVSYFCNILVWSCCEDNRNKTCFWCEACLRKTTSYRMLQVNIMFRVSEFGSPFQSVYDRGFIKEEGGKGKAWVPVSIMNFQTRRLS